MAAEGVAAAAAAGVCLRQQWTGGLPSEVEPAPPAVVRMVAAVGTGPLVETRTSRTQDVAVVGTMTAGRRAAPAVATSVAVGMRAVARTAVVVAARTSCCPPATWVRHEC